MNELRNIVFSRTLKQVEWQNARLATAAAAEEVARLRQAPARDVAILKSADLAASLVRFGLIDECRFVINPLGPGGGTPLQRAVERRYNLQLVNTETLRAGVIALYYRPR